jgi:hypothetical protein
MAEIPVGTDMQERAYGVLLLLIGAFATYYFILSPYLDMQSGAEEVEFGLKTAVLGPVAASFGGLQVVLGRRAAELLGRGEYDMTWRSYAILAAMFGTGLGAYFWLQAQASALGYA